MNKDIRNGQVIKKTPSIITPAMMILDIISEYRETEAIFKGLEVETGSCVCCRGLFLSLREAAVRFGFNLDIVLGTLNAAVTGASGESAIRKGSV
ncbi:MAG: hypothetical protein JXL20_06425 [Deltaproteobacteria bacterium]|nr:hypothetical protein [Deltaproteobacteria bacterium]